MTISVSPDVQEYLQAKVREGCFASEGAAVDQAVRFMKRQEEKLADLRQKIQASAEQVHRGEFEEWSLEEAKADLLTAIEREAKGR